VLNMSALPTQLRNRLEATVKQARRTAEAAAKVALERLTVGGAEPDSLGRTPSGCRLFWGPCRPRALPWAMEFRAFGPDEALPWAGFRPFGPDEALPWAMEFRAFGPHEALPWAGFRAFGPQAPLRKSAKSVDD